MPSGLSLRTTPQRISPRLSGLCVITETKAPVGLLSIAPAVLLSASFWLKPPSPRDPPAVTVLCYHNFDAQKITPFNITSARFREQLRFLKVQRYPVIPLSDLVEHLRNGKAIPDHAVVITID